MKGLTNQQSAKERFELNVDRSADCWTWRGSHFPTGYAKFMWNGRHRAAHIFAYEQKNGPVPKGLVLDHRCRNRGCVNPSHVEPVTNQANILRGIGVAAINTMKTACKRGHPFTPENTIPQSGPGRNPKHRKCRACKNEWAKRNR